MTVADVSETAVPPPPVDLATIGEVEYLRSIWKKSVRGKLRQMRMQDLQLIRDPLEWAGLDREIDPFLEGIISSLKSKMYRPDSGDIIRSAKSVGLTRPLSQMQPADILVYKGIVSRAEAVLAPSMKPWTRFGRADVRGRDAFGGDSGWFRAWLARQDQLWTITGAHAWIVESDVTNFFPSIDRQLLIGRLLQARAIDEDIKQVLERIWEAMTPPGPLRQQLGLPQEDFDASRILAHWYLKPVDDEFSSEGEAGRYSRWMDDIAVGADTWPEALRAVARIQRSMETLGLTPNTKKTRIIPSSDFVLDYMKVENDSLGELEEAWDADRFGREAREFIRANPRRKAWEQILRRYYSTARRHGHPYLVGRALKDLGDVPTSARHFFDLLGTRHLTVSRIRALRDKLEELGDVYEDVTLLALEYCATAPNLDSLPLRLAIADWALMIATRRFGDAPNIAASAVVVVMKFGFTDHVERLQSLLPESAVDSAFRRQLLLALCSAGRLVPSESAWDIEAVSRETLRERRFLSALSDGERSVVGRALNLLHPIERQSPIRLSVRPRALLLAPLLRKGGLSSAMNSLDQWAQRMRRANGRQFMDSASLRWLLADEPISARPSG